MKKNLCLVIATFLTLALAAFQPCQAEDGVTCGCYQKNHGQLRIVGDCSECLPSEVPIIFSQATVKPKLAVVTAVLKFHEPDYEEHSLVDDATFFITNQQNIELAGDDWKDVFEIRDEHVNPDGEIHWGLRCKDENGWVNTSCSQSLDQPGYSDVDLPQYGNGCYSDNEEYESMSLFCTCSKILSE